MKSVVLKFAILILNALYLPLKIFPVDNKVTFITRQDNSLGIDMRLLVDYISENYKEIKVIALSKKLDKSAVGAMLYSTHLLKQMYHIATSKVVIIDGYCIPVSILNHRKELKVIQLWHALGAVKKFGYDSLDKPSGSSRKIAEIMKMHNNYDYVVAASSNTAKHFCSGFNTDISKAKLLGLPRIDYIKRIDEEKQVEIRKRYGLKDYEKLVLYVPTFRKGEHLPLEEMISSFDLEESVLVIKLHPLDETPIPQYNNKNIIIDKEFSSYEWARISDKIITDYSALAVEGALLDVPMYLYIYDYEQYSNDPGLNIDLKAEFGKYASENINDLMCVMKEKYEFDRLKAFRKKYVTIDNEKCTENLANFIVDLIK